MKADKNIFIKEINTDFSQELSSLLKESDEKYSRFFIPFEFDRETIKKILVNKKNDKYYGIFIEKKLVGFYMLRGFDEGYSIPSYGVWIAKEYSNLGLGKLSLYHAISFCKTNQIQKIILKVHPENLVAKKMYETAGFKFTGQISKIGHLLYEKII